MDRIDAQPAEEAGAQATARGGRALSRRTFARGMAIGAASLVIGGGLAGCAPRALSERDPERIARTVDTEVLVVGGGGAGVSAAGWSAKTGAKTILIEKLSWLGGSSSLALGTFYGAGTELQRKAGIEDSPEGLLAYFLRRGGDKLDYDIQKFCADHFGETIDWLAGELGVPFKDEPAIKGTDTVPRGHLCANAAIDALTAVAGFALNQGAEFHYSMAAERIHLDESGTVDGIVARDASGENVLYRARKVIMASGGFCRNPEMIDRYMPEYSGVYTEVGVGLTGEGLQMGLDIGADYIGHGGTNGILACPIEPGQSKLISNKVMWVDSSGKRFENEGGQTHDIYYAVAHFPDQRFYAVYDRKALEALDEGLQEKVRFGLREGHVKKAETIEEAAEAFGIDGATLAASLARYNEMAHAGVDSDFKKKAALLKPLEAAPYYIIEMGVCTHGSFGGYRVNTDLQALDAAGEPIENLYAVGEVSSGTFIYDDYPSGGCGLNWSYTSGRFAGTHAANAVLQERAARRA